MNTHRIFVSNGEDAANVQEYLIESNASVQDVVKAMTINVLTDLELSTNEVERITFDADALSNRYVCVISCPDYNIAVWCQNNEPKRIDLPYTGLAATLDDDWAIDNEENTEEYDKFFNMLYGDN